MRKLCQHVVDAQKSFIVCHIRDSVHARSVVQVSKDGNVKRLLEKFQSYESYPVLSNSGIYFFLENEDLSTVEGLDIVNSQLQHLISNKLLGSVVVNEPRVSVDSPYALEQAVNLANIDKLMKAPC